MKHDLQDRLLEWLSRQKASTRKLIDKRTADLSFQEGKYAALLDIQTFILTDGRISEPLLMKLNKGEVKEL